MPTAPPPCTWIAGPTNRSSATDVGMVRWRMGGADADVREGAYARRPSGTSRRWHGWNASARKCKNSLYVQDRRGGQPYSLGNPNTRCVMKTTNEANATELRTSSCACGEACSCTPVCTCGSSCKCGETCGC